MQPPARFRPSIRKKILGIAVGLIFLMVITAALSMVMSGTVAHLLRELNDRYIPAYDSLANANVSSLERALAFRQMVIAKLQTPPDEAAYAAKFKIFQDKDRDVDRQILNARNLINSIIEDRNTPSDNAALARIDSRLESASQDIRRRLNTEDVDLLNQLDAKDFDGARRTLARVDELRNEFMERTDRIREDMLGQVLAGSAIVIRSQENVLLASATVTALAALLGLAFAFLVSSGITRALRMLLQGARDIEAGHLDKAISIRSNDEIGDLSVAFNRMIDQLRENERVREAFGRYIDPRIVRGLLDKQELGAEGQHRIMTVLFCDMKGFTSLSEGVTPQGLVKLMNSYLTTMSEPIRDRRGIIDKYIGDAIMAYWGPPFVDKAEQASLALLAAIDMCDRVAGLRKALPELLGVRSIPMECDVRIGVATGEVLVGSIGSQFMMNYTVMGDAVNLASRLESANKLYGTRILAPDSTVSLLDSQIEVREIDRLIVAGQTHAQIVFEILGRNGELSAAQMLLRARYADGLAAYRARRWDDARGAFTAALEVDPADGPSAALLRRIDRLQNNPPSEEWDGSWRSDGK